MASNCSEKQDIEARAVEMTDELWDIIGALDTMTNGERVDEEMIRALRIEAYRQIGNLAEMEEHVAK